MQVHDEGRVTSALSSAMNRIRCRLPLHRDERHSRGEGKHGAGADSSPLTRCKEAMNRIDGPMSFIGSFVRSDAP